MLAELGEADSELAAIERARVRVRREYHDVPVLFRDAQDRVTVAWPEHAEFASLNARESELTLRRNQLLFMYAELRRQPGFTT